MDPRQALEDVAEHIREAKRSLEAYYNWRHKGGYEPYIGADAEYTRLSHELRRYKHVQV